MMAWNMVAVLPVGDALLVPCWSVDPAIVRYMPTLSEVFQGEALIYCLTHMRPFGDDRSGVDALQAGEWKRVLDLLREFRRRFDQVLEPEDAAMLGLLAQAHVATAAVRLH